MSALVLDAGALLAVERRDRPLWALLTEARDRGTDIVIPATVLAQAWRGGPRMARLVDLLRASRVDTLDEDRAKAVGMRLGERNGRDVADAHVVCCAVDGKASIVTSDPDDVTALGAPSDELIVIRV